MTRLLALNGSPRPRGHNANLLRAVAELLPHGADLVLHDYKDVPLYDPELGRPEGVTRLCDAIAAADGLLIASPEYNHSVPGVLKNALDWASRPAYASVLLGKPTGVMTASPGAVGGARAQLHLENILAGTGTPLFPGPKVCVGQAGERFDGEGRLVHEPTRAFLRTWLAGLVPWVAGYPRAQV